MSEIQPVEDPEPSGHFTPYPVIPISRNANYHYQSHADDAIEDSSIEEIVNHVRHLTNLNVKEERKFSFARSTTALRQRLGKVVLTERGIFDERHHVIKGQIDRKIKNGEINDAVIRHKNYYNEIENNSIVSVDIYSTRHIEKGIDSPVTYFVDREKDGELVLKRKLYRKIANALGSEDVNEGYEEEVTVVSDATAASLCGLLRNLYATRAETDPST